MVHHSFGIIEIQICYIAIKAFFIYIIGTENIKIYTCVIKIKWQM